MSASRPNIVLIVADELQAACLRWYGSDKITTPGMDRLASTGTVFTAAYCNSPVCTPSRYSMLSGRYPWGIGAYHNQSPTPSAYPSIAHVLTRQGYDTVAIGKMHFKGSDQMWGYTSRPYGDFGGLSHQPDPIGSAPGLSFVADAGPADIPEDQQHDSIVADLACGYLRSVDRSQPFLLHLSFNFPHYPLRPPERLFDAYYPSRADLPRQPDSPATENGWMRERRSIYKQLLGEGTFSPEQIRRARAAYYGCVGFVDEQLNRVLDELDSTGLADQTVVIFTADHGEMLGERGTWEKNCFYEEAVRVPLLVRVPGATAPSQVADIVELVDLLPTLCRIAGVDDPPEADGEDLLPLIGFPGHRNKRLAISELAPTYMSGIARMVRKDRWKLIWHDGYPPSLFDMVADPDELDDLGESASHARIRDGLIELADTDTDRVKIESESATLAVHPSYADVSPNQYRSRDGRIADAESFYQVQTWIPEQARVPRYPRRRPAISREDHAG